MAKSEWFRKASWSPEDEADFFARLQRARLTSRAQYLRIQAIHLSNTGSPALLEAAVVLLDRFILSYPHDVFIAQAHTQRANCLADLERPSEAVEAFRAAFSAMRRFPSVRPNTETDFGLFVVERHLQPLYDEALALLDEFDHASPFPLDVYCRQGIRAILNARKGRLDVAAPAAARALKAAGRQTSGLRYHPNLGLVEDRSSSFHRELLAIAPDRNA
jgi:tetratricopeptide (TPR) repeat protein